jgi:acyl dehydratase
MLYFEDFTQGRRFDYSPVLMQANDMIAFASEFDPQPMHLDEEVGKSSILGGSPLPVGTRARSACG